MNNRKNIEVLLENAEELVDQCDKQVVMGTAVKDIVAAIRLLIEDVEELNRRT
jgi:hypothetical protein